MVCEKMLFLFLLGTFVTVLFCHFPFDCTFSGYSTQWSVGIEGLEVWNVSVGGARGPAEPAGPAGPGARAGPRGVWTGGRPFSATIRALVAFEHLIFLRAYLTSERIISINGTP